MEGKNRERRRENDGRGLSLLRRNSRYDATWKRFRPFLDGKASVVVCRSAFEAALAAKNQSRIRSCITLSTSSAQRHHYTA